MQRLALFVPITILSLAAQTPKHPAVCGKGVRTYASLKDVPTPFDSLKLPPGPPIRVNSPEEAEAAETQILALAGSVGATGLVEMEESEDQGGSMVVRRRVIPVFVPADTGRAYAACRK